MAVSAQAAGEYPAASVVEPILDVDGVTLQYKTKEHLITATYRVSFQIYPSDRFVLLGLVLEREGLHPGRRPADGGGEEVGDW